MGGSDSSGSGFRLRRAQLSSSSLERLSGSGDLIEDIHRQHRRRILKRAAQFAALAVVLLLAGLAFKLIADRRARADALAGASEHLMLGTVSELDVAVQLLDLGLERNPDDPNLTGLRALSLGHRWLEFGVGEDPARAALTDRVGVDGPAASVAAAMLAFADGDIDGAQTALAPVLDDGDPGEEDDPSLHWREAAWLSGLVTVASAGREGRPAGYGSDLPDDDPRLAARQRVAAWVEVHPHDVAMRRMLASLQLHTGQTETALATLEALRDDAETHMGLAADDALYHAVLRTKLAGVASVADQLLEKPVAGLSRTDRAHAVLARAVVHAHSGEQTEALERLDEAWEQLAAWNLLDRRLAIETALQAGDTERMLRWVKQAGLPVEEASVYRAWGVLLEGDVMKALAQLAELDQTRPHVAYLQALALAEQGRWPEAAPWLERAETLLPGRVEIEVARARTELRVGNPDTARRKLEALAEFEPYAPRAWTGLGEAYLLAEPPDLEQGQRALRKAIEREPVPAEATLLLADATLREGGDDPKAQTKALGLYERAAKLNPALPKYGVALALHLETLGLDGRAHDALEDELDRPGVGWQTPMALARVRMRQAEPDPADLRALLDVAEERKAPAPEVAVMRARIALLEDTEDALAAARAEIDARVDAVPADVGARAVQVRLLLAQKDQKSAELAIRRGLQAAEEGTKGRLLLEWARLESRTGKKRTAAPRSRRAWVELLAEPDRRTWELLDAADLSVELWLRNNREQVALAVAKQATERLDYHSEAWRIRARAELAAGETKDAQQAADKAIERDPNNPRAHELRGHCLLRFGMRDEAKAAYEKAVELARGTDGEKGFLANLKRL